MVCDDLDALIESYADGSVEPGVDAASHLAACPVCAARLVRARRIEQALAARDLPAPPATFTTQVMAHIGREQWQTERAFDIGFNLAMLAGVLVILSGAAGLAWSLGFLTITVDLDAVWNALGAEVTGRLLSQLQTVALGAVLLTMALVLWWWAETATDQ